VWCSSAVVQVQRCRADEEVGMYRGAEVHLQSCMCSGAVDEACRRRDAEVQRCRGAQVEWKSGAEMQVLSSRGAEVE
jgi:hypothetical protein